MKLEGKINSIACRYSDFLTDWYRRQEEALKIREIFVWHSAAEVDFVNRKFWEWCVITQALLEKGKLSKGSRGLGFAVGTEILTSYFASLGCKIVATDLAKEHASEYWVKNNEHASSLESLFYPQIIDRVTLSQNVSFLPVDMRDIRGLEGEFDFLWSSCAFEHLGSLQAGLDFVVNSAGLLRKGGVAVHTTEFNVSNSLETISHGDNVIYRKSDFVFLDGVLESKGFRLSPLNFDVGDHEYDLAYDTAPYFGPGKRHLKLEMDGHIATSFLLVIQRL